MSNPTYSDYSGKAYGVGDILRQGALGDPYLTVHNDANGNGQASSNHPTVGQFYNGLSRYFISRGELSFSTIAIHPEDIISANLRIQFGDSALFPYTSSDYLEFFDATGIAYPPVNSTYGPLGALTSDQIIADDINLTGLSPSPTIYESNLNAAGLALLKATIPLIFRYGLRVKKDTDSVAPGGGDNGGYVYLQSVYLRVYYNPTDVQTNAADLITGTSARLNGFLASDGGETCECRFEYWEGSDPHLFTDWTQVNEGNPFSFTVFSLLSNTGYNFHAQVRNSKGTFTDDDYFFTTLTIVAPTVTTLAATGVT